MEPLLALAAVRSVAGIVSSLAAATAPAAPRAAVNTQAPRPQGPFAKGAGFERALQAELGKQGHTGPLSFSPEAAKQLEAMGVRLNQAQYEKLFAGVQEAAAKGSQRALVMMDGMAFTVDVRSGKVLGAANRNRFGNNVYPNVDTIVETKV